MELPTLENNGGSLTTAQAYDDEDIPILDRINDDDLSCNWKLGIRQQSPCPPAPPSSPESENRSRSRSARAHSSRGPISTWHPQIESHKSPVFKDPRGHIAVCTEPPSLYNDYSSMINAYQESSFSDDDEATRVDVSSPTRSYFSDSDSITVEPSKHSPYPAYTWDAVEPYKRQETQRQKALSLFPKPSPYDAHPRREYLPLHDLSPPPRRNISYPIMNVTALAQPVLADASACRANSWPSSTTTFEPGRASPTPPSIEETSGWFPDDEEKVQRERLGKRLSRRLRRAFSCGNQGERS